MSSFEVQGWDVGRPRATAFDGARCWWKLFARHVVVSKAALVDPGVMPLFLETVKEELLEDVADAHAWIGDGPVTVQVVEANTGDLFTRNLGAMVLAEVTALELVIPDPFPRPSVFPRWDRAAAWWLEVRRRGRWRWERARARAMVRLSRARRRLERVGLDLSRKELLVLGLAMVAATVFSFVVTRAVFP